jgi:hypothetical protein
VQAPVGHAGLALWSFMMSTAHGAGLMLVPALIPLCIGNAPAREITASGSLMLALAAIGVHIGAMLGDRDGADNLRAQVVSMGDPPLCQRITLLFPALVGQ